MEFRILGMLEVSERGCVFDPGGSKRRGLLGAILLRLSAQVSLDELVDEVWGRAVAAR